MGPVILMLTPFVIWFIGFSVVTDIIAWLVDKFVSFHCPEDDEVWDADDPFIMPLDK